MCTSADHIDLSCLRKAQRECQESRSLLAQQIDDIRIYNRAVRP